MSLITRMLKQDGVYWGAPVDDFKGGFTYPTPVAIKCRWESNEGETVDPVSHDKTDSSIVYVDRDIVKDGYLYFGDLADVLTENPADLRAAKKITGFAKVPNLKCTEFLRTATI